MIVIYELVVKFSNRFVIDQLTSGEVFNTGFARCCAWIQYGCPITVNVVNKLMTTGEWRGGETTGYWTAVQVIGNPLASLFEPSFQLPSANNFKVYSLFFSGKQGIALALGRLNIHKPFPPTKNLEWCECYIFDPLNGLYYVGTRGLTKFDRIFKQEIVNLAAEVLAPRDKSQCKDLCWADITKHVMFTIKANGGSKSANFR